MPDQVISIIAVAQTPPPFHGQAVMNQFFLDGEYSRFRLTQVRMAFSNEIQEVGRFRLKKLSHLFAVFFRIVLARFQTRSRVLYYPPASPNMVPFLRDCILLIGTRWLFEKTVFHFHATGLRVFYDRLPWVLKKAFGWAYGRPDLSISISNFAKADAEFINSMAITIIPNGIPSPQTSTKPRKKSQINYTEIIFCGMVCEEKGVGILLESCACLKNSGFEFRCKIIGDPASKDQKHKFSEFIDSHRMNDFIHFVGPLHGNEKWSAYENGDIFCFPTFYPAETFPLVVIEAMMFSLPVVATNWRGLPDIVIDGETGYLVPPNDAKSIAQRLEFLISNPTSRREMGSAGRRRYEQNFTLEKFHSHMEEGLSLVL